MIAVKRKQYILAKIGREKVVMVSSLSREMGVTEETVRRDLEKLEAEGSICRVHGGAYLREGYGNETTVDVRAQILQGQKQALARACMPLIGEKETVFLDCSTTAACIGQALMQSGKKLSVITNSLKLATLLQGAESLRLVMLGGELSPRTASFCGPVTEQSLDSYYADKAFISSAGISAGAGIADYTCDEAAVRAKMLARAAQSYFVGDSSKLGRTAMYSIAPLQGIQGLVTDAPVAQHSKALQTALEKQSIPIILAQSPREEPQPHEQ